MLLRFRVGNHRSIRHDHELSLVATEFNEGTARPTGVRAEGREIGVVPVAGIFGANASGKSNVLGALRAMREAVSVSLAAWAQLEGVPREPFALDPQARDDTSLYEVDLLLGEPQVRYTYGFELSDDRIEAEWLHAYPHGRKQVWFDREANREGGGDDFTFPGDGLKGGRKLARFTRPNSLYLTVAASLNDPHLAAIHRWFLDNLWIITPEDAPVPRGEHTRRLLADATDNLRHRRQIEALLRVADLGIAGVRIDRSLATDDQVRLLHHSGTGAPMPLTFTQESLGTFAWFSFLGPLLTVLDEGSVLLVDELDASLHPMLAAEVVRLFQDQDANPRGGQLIFTTHDATLLGASTNQRPLDRDQVWITAKQPTGETDLYPLIDARPRKEDNLERSYLRGRYGGVPRVTAGELAREVAQVLAETM